MDLPSEALLSLIFSNLSIQEHASTTQYLSKGIRVMLNTLSRSTYLSIYSSKVYEKAVHNDQQIGELSQSNFTFAISFARKMEISVCSKH